MLLSSLLSDGGVQQRLDEYYSNDLMVCSRTKLLYADVIKRLDVEEI